MLFGEISLCLRIFISAEMVCCLRRDLLSSPRWYIVVSAVIAFSLRGAQGIRIIIFLEWTTLFFLSIKDENFTRISRITRKHTLLSLVCCRPEGKREWNDAFFAWFARFAWAKNSVRWECFYNAFSLLHETGREESAYDYDYATGKVVLRSACCIFNQCFALL